MRNSSAEKGFYVRNNKRIKHTVCDSGLETVIRKLNVNALEEIIAFLFIEQVHREVSNRE